MSAATSLQAELCAARYVAQQIGGHVVLYAMGAHHSNGCVVFFRREPGEEFPPCFSLWHLRGAPPQVEVLTPFMASASFQTTRRVERISVVDAHGSRDIAVDALAAAQVLHTA